MQIPRFSVRELFLITALVALLIPYIYTAGQKTFLPQYDFKVTQDDLLGWIHTVDPSATWQGTSDVGGSLDDSTEYTVEHAPGSRTMDAIKNGIITKLDKDGWSLGSHGWGAGGLSFHFRKGPSRWRLFVYEIENKTHRPPILRAAHTFLIVRVHDSKPDL